MYTPVLSTLLAIGVLLGGGEEPVTEAAAGLTSPIMQPAAILDGCQICDEPEPEKHHFHPWECDDEDTGCYSCDVGAPGNQGCHPSEQNQTCNQWHAHCSVMAFAETLDDAYDARNLGQIAEMVAAEPDAYLLHSARQSLQMYDCNGDIVGNLTFRDHEFNALTILIQQAAPEPF